MKLDKILKRPVERSIRWKGPLATDSPHCDISRYSKPYSTQEIRTDKFWAEIEEETGAVLPTYLKRILSFVGFDNDVALQGFDPDDHIPVIEVFAKTKLKSVMESLIVADYSDVLLEDYYGPYHRSVNDFGILVGHRIVLQKLGEHCKKRLASRKTQSPLTENPEPKVQSETAEQSSMWTVSTSTVCGTFAAVSGSRVNNITAKARYSKQAGLQRHIRMSIPKMRGCLSERHIEKASRPNVMYDMASNGKAKIFCPLCLSDGGVEKVYSTVYNYGASWNISKYREHLLNFHGLSETNLDSDRSGNHELRTQSRKRSITGDMLRKSSPTAESSSPAPSASHCAMSALPSGKPTSSTQASFFMENSCLGSTGTAGESLQIGFEGAHVDLELYSPFVKKEAFVVEYDEIFQ